MDYTSRKDAAPTAKRWPKDAIAAGCRPTEPRQTALSHAYQKYSAPITAANTKR